MTSFEQKGVQMQLRARNRKDAQRKFEYSCTSCCRLGLRIDCDRCAISVAYDTSVSAFDAADLHLKTMKLKPTRVFK